MDKSFFEKAQAALAAMQSRMDICANDFMSLNEWRARLSMQGMASYNNTISAAAIALDGNATGLAAMGYMKRAGNLLMPFQFFPHPQTGQCTLHLYQSTDDQPIRAIGWTRSILDSKGFTDIPIILRRFAPEQLRVIKGFFPAMQDAPPWFDSAPYEDDTIGNIEFCTTDLVLDIKEPAFGEVRRRINRLNNHLQKNNLGNLEWHAFGLEHAAAAQEIITEFFAFDDEKKRRISQPEHYQNLIGENPHPYNIIRQIGFVGDQPVAWFLLERIQDDDWALVVNMALHDQYPGLSEATVLQAATVLDDQGGATIHMGGSENDGLWKFKIKFLPKDEDFSLQAAKPPQGSAWQVLRP